MDYFISQKSGKHINYGSSTFTVNKIKHDEKIWLPVTGKPESKTMFNQIRFQQKYSFLSYIFSGCEINLAIAIDFTQSNKDPSVDENSLHSKNLEKNQYYQALTSVGDIL
mmetsp:Transcript_39991/g.61195  ORF Transcript_39991/g.61195 Transcript_39991/m.61195 type:complete len:110 (+) Transcript_39991:521-850(+)